MSNLTVPVDEIGSEHHCLGHVGLSEEGFQLLSKALNQARLDATADEAEKYEELIRDFLLVTPID